MAGFLTLVTIVAPRGVRFVSFVGKVAVEAKQEQGSPKRRRVN
jgi:hypothetical protein